MKPLTAKFCHQFRGVCFYRNSGGQSCLKYSFGTAPSKVRLGILLTEDMFKFLAKDLIYWFPQPTQPINSTCVEFFTTFVQLALTKKTHLQSDELK